MTEEEREKKNDKRREQEKRRIERFAERMEDLKEIATVTGNEVEPGGDPFAMELSARLRRMNRKDHEWGSRTKARNRIAKREAKGGITPPRSWEAGEMRGLAVLEKALLFLSTFKKRRLGFRSIQIMIMCAGRDAISMQEAADLSGISFTAVGKAVRQLEEDGYLELARIPRHGKQKPLVQINLTDLGGKVMRILNRFDPDKIDSYDRAVAIGEKKIPKDLRILQMKNVLDEANNIQQDI
jgi:DNA-binding MarR family transcriptional regulator